MPEGFLHPIQSNKFLANPAAPSEQAGKLQKVGGSGGFSTGQVKVPQPPKRSIIKPSSLTTEAVDVASVASPNQMGLQRSQPDCAGTVESDTSASPVLTPAHTAQQQRWQKQEAAKEAEQQLWLISGNPILVKEAEAWFAGQIQRLPLQVTVEQTDPGG